MSYGIGPIIHTLEPMLLLTSLNPLHAMFLDHLLVNQQMKLVLSVSKLPLLVFFYRNRIGYAFARSTINSNVFSAQYAFGILELICTLVNA
jgi:hypothetical protein